MVLGRKRERRYLRGIKRGVTGREREREVNLREWGWVERMRGKR